MMNDLDIKNKRILLFDFDGTLIETASGNTFATDLTDMRIKMDVVNKTAIVYHKSDLDGVVSAAIATMYENSKNKDVIYIPYSYEDDVKKVVDKVRDLLFMFLTCLSEPILKRFSRNGLMKERA